MQPREAEGHSWQNATPTRTATTKTDLEDPLGIAGTPVPPDAPEHMHATNDEEEARRRRQRGLSADNDAPRVPTGDINTDHKGATGIDMGAGGQGTQISDKGTKP